MIVRVDSPYGEHFTVEPDNAPNGHVADDVYETMTRVRDWDRIYEAGFIPLPNGRKRAILTVE